MRTTRFARSCAVLVFVLSFACLGGCTQEKRGSETMRLRGTRDFSSTRLFRTEIEKVRPAADHAFKGQALRVDPAASSADVWISRPKEMTDSARVERVRDVLRGPTNRHRYLAELRLVQEGADVLVLCRVQTQRLDTAERNAFARARDAGDRPSDERPAQDQNVGQSAGREEWVTVGHDRQTERLILEAIRKAIESGQRAD